MSEARFDATQEPSNKRPMQLVSEHHVPDPPQLTPPSLPPSPTTTKNDLNDELISRHAWKQGILASITVISQVLAVRVVLLVAVLGAVFLTYLALSQHDVLRLGALAIYCAVVVAPVVALSYRRG